MSYWHFYPWTQNSTWHTHTKPTIAGMMVSNCHCTGLCRVKGSGTEIYRQKGRHSMYIFGHTHSMWKFLAQGSNLSHSSNPSCCSGNAGSLTCCVPQENTYIFKVCLFWSSHCGSVGKEPAIVSARMQVQSLAGNCSFKLTPSLGTSICRRCSPTKKKKINFFQAWWNFLTRNHHFFHLWFPNSGQDN